MRNVCPAILVALSMLVPNLASGQLAGASSGVTGEPLSITNYQPVSVVVATPTQWYLTYRADVVNTGVALGSVTATVNSTDPYVIRNMQGMSTLDFTNVPANSQVTSSNTFSLLATSTTLDPTKLQWTFQTTPLGPIANPGANQTATVGSTVTLNGSGSTSPSGVLSYSWKFTSRPAGSSTVIWNWTSVMPSFVVDIAGTYVVSLTVSNGVASSTANVTITTHNTPPVANAGKNQTVAVGATALLNGSGSSDVDGDPLTYSWTFVSRPNGSAAALTGATTVGPSFVVDQAGPYTIQLVVNDGFSNSAPSQVTISTLNSPPVANAGPGQAVSVGATVQLDGSASTDTDGNTLTYSWSLTTLPTGSVASLTNPTTVNPTFTADVSGVYIAQLIVNDGVSNSQPSTVTIATGTILPPVANAGNNQTVTPGTVVSLTGGGNDPQSLPLSYHWALTTRPANSSAALSSATVANPTFSADLSGTYIAQLIVNNGILSSSPTTVTITATAPTGIQVPSVVVSPSNSVPLNVTLGSPAPTNGLFITLASSDPTIATVTAVIVIPGGATSPTTMPKVNGIAFGSVTITATAVGYPPAIGTVQVTEVLNFSPNSLTITGATKQQLYLFISGPAPAAGVTLNLSSSNPGVATAPPTVFIRSGVNNVNVPVTGISGGSTVIHASGANIADTTANVTVNAPVSGGPATVAVMSGSPQTATVGGAFVSPLVVIVKDSGSNPLSGVTVTFAAPGSGASGTFAGGVTTAVTNASGIATSAVFTANGTAGAYSVSASAVGVGTPAVFNLTNAAVAPLTGPAVTATSGTPQTTQINTMLGAPLVVTVTDASGNPSNGVLVTFTVPGSGASGTFASGVNTALTNASGIATSAMFTANGTGGSFSVTASAPGIATPATFSLTNISLNPTDIAITGPMTIGQGLQLQGVVTLGTPAPAGGLVVSIASNNPIDPFLLNGGPRQIQVAPTGTSVGVDSTTITIPAGASSGTYYVQGTGTLGSVSYTVTAPGYNSQTAWVTLQPSSFVVATSQGFGQPISVSLSAYQQNHIAIPISVYGAMINPLTDAFVVNQQLAGGTTAVLSLVDTNSAAGSVVYPVTIVGGTDHVNAQFTPQGVGTTVITVSRHPGNPAASTDGSVTITVTP